MPRPRGFQQFHPFFSTREAATTRRQGIRETRNIVHPVRVRNSNSKKKKRLRKSIEGKKSYSSFILSPRGQPPPLSSISIIDLERRFAFRASSSMHLSSTGESQFFAGWKRWHGFITGASHFSLPYSSLLLLSLSSPSSSSSFERGSRHSFQRGRGEGGARERETAACPGWSILRELCTGIRERVHRGSIIVVALATLSLSLSVCCVPCSHRVVVFRGFFWGA